MHTSAAHIPQGLGTKTAASKCFLASARSFGKAIASTHTYLVLGSIWLDIMDSKNAFSYCYNHSLILTLQ